MLSINTCIIVSQISMLPLDTVGIYKTLVYHVFVIPEWVSTWPSEKLCKMFYLQYIGKKENARNWKFGNYNEHSFNCRC